MKPPREQWEDDAVLDALEASLSDPVNNPAHYTDGGIETIDYLQAKLTPEEFKGFCKGNAIKYMSRAGKKGDPVEDYQKAMWYLERLAVEDR